MNNRIGQANRKAAAVYLLVGFMSMWGAGTDGHAGQPPDPVTLLQGVEAARLQTPPSRLQMRAVYRTDVETSAPELLVEFDGDRRRYVKSKVGPDVRSIFDSSNVFLFDGTDSVTIRDRSNATSDYLFDPRLLGLTTAYSWRQTLARVLPYRDAVKMETVGREQVNNHPAWHVHAVDTYNQKLDLWIDEQNGFRVYRYDSSIDGVTNSTRSYYENSSYPWLPSRVETQYREGYGKYKSERVFSVLKAEAKVRFPASTWTIAGLKPPIGTPVTDIRIKRRVGYWDGVGLSQEPKSSRPRTNHFVIAMIAVLLIVPALIFFRFRPK